MLIMVGVFPPPVHGMSFINSAMFRVLSDAGMNPRIIDISPKSLSRSFAVRVLKPVAVLRGLLSFTKLLAIRESNVVYIALAGGNGQVYDLAFTIIARLFRARLFIHHHSYAYLDKPQPLTWLLFRFAGVKACHITLSDGMTRLLRIKYSRCIGDTFAVSNIAFLAEQSTAQVRLRVKILNIGFLGNISKEKGIFEFIETLDALSKRGFRLNGLIAGPFSNSGVEQEVKARIAAIPSISYLGPKYGSAKTEFLGMLDVLLFPSSYSNEAEPLVIHEALQLGLPVISTARGSIPEILNALNGHVVPPGIDFVDDAVQTLSKWIDYSESFVNLSAGSIEISIERRLCGQDSLRLVLDSMKSSNGG